MLRHVQPAPHRRGRTPQRRRLLGASLLRATGPDQLRAGRLGPPSYPRPVLRRIAFIVFAQRIGLTLEEIGAELAKLPPHQAPTRRDWSHLSATWTSRIDERIAELERLKLGLTECIGCGCLCSAAAGSPTPVTAQPPSVPAPATGLATDRRADKRISGTSWPRLAPPSRVRHRQHAVDTCDGRWREGSSAARESARVACRWEPERDVRLTSDR